MKIVSADSVQNIKGWSLGFFEEEGFMHNTSLDDSRSQENADSFLLQEEREKVLEEAKAIALQQGYDAGYREGFDKGYSDSLEKAKLELANIERDRSNLHAVIDKETDKYLLDKKHVIFDFLYESLQKVLFGVLEKEDVMIRYFSNLIEHFSLKYEQYELSLNNSTYSRLLGFWGEEELNRFLNEKNVLIKIDNKIAQNDFLIKTEDENIEIFLKDQLEKISEILK